MVYCTSVKKMAGYRNRYEINDEKWEQVKDWLPSETVQKQGRPSRPNRQILNAILWIAKSGAAWMLICKILALIVLKKEL